jgi:hypothetical protein
MTTCADTAGKNFEGPGDFAGLLRMGSIANATANELRAHSSDADTSEADAAGSLSALSAHYRCVYGLVSDAVTPLLRVELGALLGPTDGAAETVTSLQFAYAGLAAWCAAVISTRSDAPAPRAPSPEGPELASGGHVGYL